jgi:hypothetical protein
MKMKSFKNIIKEVLEKCDSIECTSKIGLKGEIYKCGDIHFEDYGYFYLDDGYNEEMIWKYDDRFSIKMIKVPKGIIEVEAHMISEENKPRILFLDDVVDDKKLPKYTPEELNSNIAYGMTSVDNITQDELDSIQWLCEKSANDDKLIKELYEQNSRTKNWYNEKAGECAELKNIAIEKLNLARELVIENCMSNKVNTNIITFGDVMNILNKLIKDLKGDGK